MTLFPLPGDLVAFCHRLVRGFAPLAERRQIALKFRSEHEVMTSVFDPDALATVFSNLLSNALKFTPEGGKVWFILQEAAFEDGRFVEVAVKDTGPGIPKDDLARIFNRFEQVDGSTTQKKEGTGIGLALAQELVELHGGRILVESDVGFGSAFTVRLPHVPLSDEKGINTDLEVANVIASSLGDGAGEHEQVVFELVQAPESESESPDVFGMPKILIVEDNADVRVFLRSQLEADYHIIEAADGEVGLKQAQAHRPDLILSDVMMPRMDGFALCHALRANEALRSVPVVLLTARAAEQDTLYGFDAGADDYLTKPFSANELRARVASLIATRQHLRERFSREVRIEPAGIAIQSEDAAFLERTLAVVEAHLGDAAFTVETLAAGVGMSSRQLTRRVRAVSGETPGALIRRLRLERAAHLLNVHTGSIAEVAYAVGFRDADHFSRRFREVYGVPPSQYVTDET